MCGRFTLRTPAPRLMDLFHVPLLPALAPRFNIAPTQLVLCIRQSAEHATAREAIMMRWGLVPFWAKDISIGSSMINARSETVAEKPAFRNAYKRQRCLIPADGFYEWQKLSTGKKQPWWIHLGSEEPFAMAGLWESWTPKHASRDDSDSVILSCTILTIAGNRDMAALHDRMPVILPVEAWSTWLNPASNASQLSPMLQQLPDGNLQFRSVSTEVNRPILDRSELLDPVESPEPLKAMNAGRTDPVPESMVAEVLSEQSTEEGAETVMLNEPNAEKSGTGKRAGRKSGSASPGKRAGKTGKKKS